MNSPIRAKPMQPAHYPHPPHTHPPDASSNRNPRRVPESPRPPSPTSQTQQKHMTPSPKTCPRRIHTHTLQPHHNPQPPPPKHPGPPPRQPRLASALLTFAATHRAAWSPLRRHATSAAVATILSDPSRPAWVTADRRAVSAPTNWATPRVVGTRTHQNPHWATGLEQRVSLERFFTDLSGGDRDTRLFRL